MYPPTTELRLQHKFVRPRKISKTRKLRIAFGIRAHICFNVKAEMPTMFIRRYGDWKGLFYPILLKI
jgi:hypothetical protein